MREHSGFRSAERAIAKRPVGDLTAAKRKKLPKSTFGLPGARKFPMPDKKHARLAKSGDSRALHVGNITASQKAKIDAKANRILGKGK